MKTYSAVGLAVSLTLLAGGVVAQEGEGLEEIVVTATKREQTLQDVPVAVSVTPVETLERAQIRTISDLQSIIPSLRVSQLQTSTQTNFIIRGFGNGANNPGIESSVGVFIDGVYRSRSAGAIGDFVDVSRVEVLRGPQSTLFGQNASAGVISIVTQKPSFDETSGMVEVTLGNYNGRVAKGKVTGPINDNLAFSLAGSVNERDGYFKNLANQSLINDRDRWDMRGQMLWKASDNVEVRIIGDVSEIDEVCCGVSNLLNGPTGAIIQGPLVGGRIYPGVANSPGLPFDRATYANKAPQNSVKNSGLSVHIDWDLGDFTLTSITASRQQDFDFDYDFDFTSGLLGTINRNLGDIGTKTQEFRVAYDGGGKVRGLLGAYYFDERVDYSNEILIGSGFRNYASILTNPTNPAAGLQTFPSLEAALGLPTGTLFAANTGNKINTIQDSEAYTLFGQLDFDVADSLTVTGGIAYTNTQKDIDYRQVTTETFSSLNFVDIGFAQIFGALTGGRAPTPANFAAFSAQAGLADAASVRPCVPGQPSFPAGPLCNSALGLYPLQFLHPIVPFSDKSDDSKTTYTLRAAYEFSDNLNAYLGVSTGYKATSWNLSRDSKPFAPATAARSPLGGAVNPYYPRYGTRLATPEEATVVELGVKGRWERFAANVAVFDQQIKDFQTNAFQGTGFVLANAGKQTTKGIEIETQSKITEGLRLDISYSYLDPEYKTDRLIEAVNLATCPAVLAAAPTNVDGKVVAGIAKHNLSAGVTQGFKVGETAGFLRADYQYQSNVQTADGICPQISSRQVNTFNASAGFSRDGWDFLIWGRNLNGDDYLIQAFPSVAQSGSFSGYPNEPRTYGVTVRKNFGGK
ncbi:MAG: TonB-dependent receptor [Gammaproteobacteria bacterium]|nr:TonB-dependent receptor [Gammaproteobacteria bacterium]